MRLSDAAELTAGVITGRVLEDKKSSAINPDNRIQVLVPRAIHDGRIDKSLLAGEYKKDDGREIPSKFLTEKGDIIIKLSSPYDSCLIGEEDEGLLIPSFCLKIKVTDPTVDRYFLLAFLNSKKCTDDLRSRCYGSVMAIVKKSDLEKVELPVFTTQEQEEIGRRYSTVKLIRAEMERYLSLEQERIDIVFGERQ